MSVGVILRVREHVDLARAVTAGAPLDAGSGLHPGARPAPVRVLVAGRGVDVLRAGAEVADDVLPRVGPGPDLIRTP